MKNTDLSFVINTPPLRARRIAWLGRERQVQRNERQPYANGGAPLALRHRPPYPIKAILHWIRPGQYQRNAARSPAPEKKGEFHSRGQRSCTAYPIIGVPFPPTPHS
jgi:hypothetical protein